MHYYFLANPLAENWRMNAYENRIFGNASIPLSNPLFLPKDFCRLRIQFPDSSSLFFFFDVANKFNLSDCEQNQGDQLYFKHRFRESPTFHKKLVGQHLTVSQCLKIAQDVALEQKPGFLSFYGTVGSPINIR